MCFGNPDSLNEDLKKTSKMQPHSQLKLSQSKANGSSLPQETNFDRIIQLNCPNARPQAGEE
jgi:hypothetical protein